MTVAASIVVVTHRGVGGTVTACLASIQRVADLDTASLHIIVVDNSDHPTASRGDYGPGVADIVRVDNRGFGAAANAGIRLARTRSDAPIVVLNDDIEVTDGWLTPLLDALDEDVCVGAVQPALLRLGTDRINSLGVRLDRFAAGADIGSDEPAGSLDGSVAIDIFTAGAVLFRSEFLDQTGGFDERYFLYYEDVDLALRGAELGWSYRCRHDSVVFHHGGATTASLGDDLIRYQERNRLWTATRFATPPVVGRAFWLSIRRLRHRPRVAHARALAAGLAGVPGALIRRAIASGRRGGAIVSANGG